MIKFYKETQKTMEKTLNPTHRTLIEARSKSFFSFMVLCITIFIILLQVNSVVAMDWDNVKSYDRDNKKATITNSLGLGSDIAELTLLTPQTVWVTPGKNVRVAEIQIEVFGDSYSNALKDIQFYNVQNKMSEQKDRTFEYKVRVESGTELIDDYEWTCDEATLLVNGSEDIKCYNKLIGKKEIPRYTWNKLNTNDLAPGVHIIGIFTNVEPGEHIEWIPTMFGIKINEWADFIGATLEAHWSYDGTIARDNDKSAFDLTGEMGGNTFNTSDISFKITGAGTKIAWGGNSVNRSCNLIAYLYAESSEKPTGAILSSGKADISLYNLTATWINISMSEYILSPDTNYSIVFGHDCGTNATDYIEFRYANAGIYNDGQMFLSTDNGSSYTTYTTLDAMFEIWNGESLIAPTVNQTFPADGQQFSIANSNILFNCTATDNKGVVNLTLAINDVANITITNTTAGENLTLQSYLNFSEGNYNWSCFASNANNVSAETVTANRTFEVYKVLPISEFFNTVTTGGASEFFNINVTTTSNLQISSADLIYNNTLYPGTLSPDGNNYTISRNLVIPSFSALINNSFFWNLTMQDGSNFNTTTHNQTVSPLSIDDCSVHETVILNYTLKNEEDEVTLNPTTFETVIELDVSIFTQGTITEVIQFNQTFNKTNSAAVCIDSELNGTSFELDASSRYHAINHSIEFHNILNQTIANTTISTIPIEVDLLDLTTTDATSFLITYKDGSLIPVPGALINIQRNYVGQGLFKSIEIPKTDSNGQTVAKLVESDVVYTIIVSDRTGVLATFDNVIAICEDKLTGECTINLNAVTSSTQISNFETVNGLSFDYSFNETNREIKLVFTTLSGASSTVELNATKYDRFGNTSVCSDLLTTSAGTLTCTIPQSYGNITVDVGVFKDNVKIKKSIETIKTDADEIWEGNQGILLFILMLTIPMMMISSGIGIVIGGIIGLILAVLLGILNTGGILSGASAVIWLIVAGMIIIWKIARLER